MNDVKSVLVTGSSGMIGTAICEELVQRRYRITGADLRHNKWSEDVDRATLICDLRARSSLDILPKDIDIVVHLAANARVFQTVTEPILARDNFEMLFNVLEFCRLSNIRRAVVASSREVYGDADKVSFAEDGVRVSNCRSPYAATKIGAEALVAAYQRCYGIDQVILRFSNVYGRYDDSDRVIPLFIRQSCEGENVTVFGKEKLLDFTYISDCISGIMKCIQRFDEVRDNVFNIASGKGTTLLQLASRIQNAVGTRGKIIVKESRAGEATKYVADISRAKELLDYEPRVSLEDGIDRTIRWYRDSNGPH